MNKKLIGLLAGTSLAVAGAAFAQSDVGSSSSGSNQDVGSSSSSSSSSSKSIKKHSDRGTGGSSMGTSSETMGSAQGQNEITGQVIQKKGSTVYVQDQMGAVVQLKTDKSTKFEGVKRNELKEGDQIRASFDVRHKTENLALSISLTTGTQGTGGASNLGSKEGSPMEEKSESPQQEKQEQMGQPSGQSSSPSDMGSGKGGSGSQSGQPDQSNY